MAKTFLIVNPRAAGGSTGRHFDDVAGAVRAAVGDHDHAFTERPLHAEELTRAALRNGSDLIIAVGGDGTINEVVNGFFETPFPGEAPRPVRKGAALGILPRGTGGDLRRTLGLDPDLRKCGPRLAGARKPIDVGRVDFVRDDGNPGARYFINVGEAGVGSEVVTLANRGSKALGGKLTFTIASLRALASWKDVAIRWSLDGGVFEEDEVTTFAVANGRYFGGGMQVAPGALIDDGLFGITIWRGYGLSDFVLKSGSMYDGSHVKFSGTRTSVARTVRLEPGAVSRAPIGIEVDGEPIGRLPATFSIVPAAIELVC
ncbi:MAG: diacylglycerol kinase family lipid kinase [Deltaproteobacteria bacterium]|nr:MAG: diacylglycerol kinase family lipid kinase [Deltaproteobacteria bacterium]TMB32062.1 MAG: diacylglycerol kinase family lipid kinase [Deltaproteobacteria bacterium]